VATVQMRNSVGEHVAGEEVELPDEEADRFILLGYAEGELSREYSDEEQAELRSSHQEVNV
jgi:hypothetical protein